MTPTIVLKDGKPYLVTGSPGGSLIINTVLQVVRRDRSRHDHRGRSVGAARAQSMEPDASSPSRDSIPI